MKIFIFTAVKNRCMLHRPVFIMSVLKISNNQDLVQPEPKSCHRNQKLVKQVQASTKSLFYAKHASYDPSSNTSHLRFAKCQGFANMRNKDKFTNSSSYCIAIMHTTVV